MRFYKLFSIFLSLFFLITACDNNKKPESTKDKASAVEYFISELNPVSTATRSRLSVNITSEADSRTAWVAVATQAAQSLQEKYLNEVVQVLGRGDCNEYDIPCVCVYYSPDGKGWDGKKSGQIWDVSAWDTNIGNLTPVAFNLAVK